MTFTWQGGEPTLMGLDFFKRAVELQNRFRKPSTQIHNALQTNATLLDDEWCRFFRESGFLVGVSLDGPREVHDAYRRDMGGACKALITGPMPVGASIIPAARPASTLLA